MQSRQVHCEMLEHSIRSALDDLLRKGAHQSVADILNDYRHWSGKDKERAA